MENRIEFRTEDSRKGGVTLIVSRDGSDFPLHSKISPLREQELYRDRFVPEKYDFLVVLGCGLGYHLMPLKELVHEYKKIIIVDSLHGIESSIRKNSYTDFLLCADNTLFVTGKNPDEALSLISEHLNLEGIRGVDIIEHPASLRIFTEYYTDIKKRILSLLNRKAGSAIAKNTFGSRYLSNALNNLKHTGRFLSLSYIEGSFQGRDAFIVSSGPGVYEFLPHIKKNRESFFIIAVDSALSVLRSESIYPDFVVSIDPQPYIMEHFQGADLSHTVPVFSLSAFPGAVDFCMQRIPENRGIFLSLNSHPVCQVVEDQNPGIHASIDSGTGSVAGDAIKLALFLGFSRIFITGMDFSFPFFNIYSRGSAYQRRYSLFFQDRLHPVETSNMNYIMKSSRAKKAGRNFTRASFLQYRESIEEMIKSRCADNVFNLKGAGLGFEKIPDISIDECFSGDRGINIDRISYIDEVLSKAVKFKRVFSVSGLVHFLLQEHVYKEFLKASLGDNVPDSAGIRYRQMLGRLIGLRNK